MVIKKLLKVMTEQQIKNSLKTRISNVEFYLEDTTTSSPTFTMNFDGVGVSGELNFEGSGRSERCQMILDEDHEIIDKIDDFVSEYLQTKYFDFMFGNRTLEINQSEGEIIADALSAILNFAPENMDEISKLRNKIEKFLG